MGYVTDDVKVLAVAVDPDGPYLLPSAASVNDGTYPIARDLYMYTAGLPTSEAQAYLDWIVGPDGQAIVIQLGFVPVKS